MDGIQKEELLTGKTAKPKKAPQKPKAKMGRPKIEIDLVTLRKLAALHPTDAEIADILGFSESTLLRGKSDPKVVDAIRQGRSNGKVSLRRLQMKAAEKGNAALLIWLGKQWLGQVENPSEADQPTAKDLKDEILDTIKDLNRASNGR